MHFMIRQKIAKTMIALEKEMQEHLFYFVFNINFITLTPGEHSGPRS